MDVDPQLQEPADEQRAELMELLGRAMQRLRADYPLWAEVVAHRQAGVAYPEVAVNMSIATSTAKNHYSMGTRCLQRVIEALEAADDGGGPRGEK